MYRCHNEFCKCYAVTLPNTPCAVCLFLNKVDSFLALFFNTCLPVLNWLTGREND